MRTRKRVREQQRLTKNRKLCFESRKDDDNMDALTAEPLHPNKHVKITSPDGSLVLHYNTSSLIKVAEYKGAFMQPPHFMEPMAPELVEEVEKIEGKSFVFTASLTHIFDGANIFTHQLATFDDMIEEFYLLSPLELFICPFCYEHYLWTRYITSLPETEKRKIERYSQSELLPIDPLDVLEHMKTNTITEDAESPSPVLFIAFLQGKIWKQHMSVHHKSGNSTARDHRVRDLLCTYFSAYNREQRLKADMSRKKGQGVSDIPLLTQQRYWVQNACYNKLRYNRLLKFVEEGSKNVPSFTTRSAFPDEQLQDQYEVEDGESNCSDFINDDDSTDGAEYEGPHYSAPSSDDDSAESSENSAGSSRSASCTISVTEDDSSTTKNNVSYDAKRGQWIRHRDAKQKHRHLFPDEELFLETQAEKKFSGSSLYDPLMHKLTINDGDNIDFEHLGEDIPTTTTIIKSKEAIKDDDSQKTCDNDNVGKFSFVTRGEGQGPPPLLIEELPRSSGKLLLDDE